MPRTHDEIREVKAAFYNIRRFPNVIGCVDGDSAYSCKEYLLTPLLNPTTVGENNYNRAQIQTRNTVERTFGVWKRRFACLSLGLRTKLNTTLEVIVATAVLHNMAALRNDYFEYFPEVEEINEINLENGVNGNNAGGNALRRSLIENHFIQ
ncbi:hypothetical protein NQ315_007950 [Exocentrus adspersus]|uniref:DDE Tnp4 domain-containing protein n=1 Tax=Exocentrus adspersus TaxID=1586481 RepID=A0AAV8VBQ4_9CUCU|nr:hypothetical protein NQ315_007950 [Exocentrus adspersus]